MSLHLFSFKEAIGTNYLTALPKEFRITTSTQYDILVMRLLTSTVDIHFLKKRETIKLQDNLTSFPWHRVTRKSSRQLKALLYPFQLKDYVKFSNKYYGRNIVFYHNILQELSYYFKYTHEGQHQAAFVNLYRILEFISYSFPLIHASHFGNYIGSFEALRSYFVNDKTSELKFFEKFVEQLFQGTNNLAYTTDFDLSNSDTVVGLNCYDSFKNLMSNADWVIANRSTQLLSIENRKLIPLFKNTRNKYFHFAVGGQRNIQNIDLKDTDFFFERINTKFLNWLGFIYGNVIKESLDNSLL